jgi:pimeloyl-[acyl-carrier protein] synthase
MYELAVGRARSWLATPGVLGFVTLPWLRARPHTPYRLLRSIDPAHRSPSGVWILTGHAEVSAALRHPAMGNDESKMDLGTLHLGPLRRLLDEPAQRALRSGQATDVGPSSPSGRLMRQLMLFRDAPDHTRLRSLVNKAFTPRTVAALEGRLEEIVHRQLDHFIRSDTREFMSQFAYPVPALVICELMGLPLSDHAVIQRCAPALAARLDPSPMRNSAKLEAADRAVQELTDYLLEVIAKRRVDPGEDLLSRLIAADEHGNALDPDELVAMGILLLIAGHETTANLLGNGLLSLLRHPEQWELFRGDEGLDRTAVEELMRFDGPIQMTQRIALQDVEVGAAAIPSGSLAVLCLAAANRDPVIFDRPRSLDLARDPNPHVGFGGGAHFCVGAALARMEARLALRAIAERLPRPSLGSQRLKWRPSFTIRGLHELRLSW